MSIADVVMLSDDEHADPRFSKERAAFQAHALRAIRECRAKGEDFPVLISIVVGGRLTCRRPKRLLARLAGAREVPHCNPHYRSFVTTRKRARKVIASDTRRAAPALPDLEELTGYYTVIIRGDYLTVLETAPPVGLWSWFLPASTPDADGPAGWRFTLPDKVEGEGEGFCYSKRGVYLLENEGDIVVLFDSRPVGEDAEGRGAEQERLRKRLKEAGVEELGYNDLSRKNEEGTHCFNLTLHTHGGGVDLVKTIVTEVLTGGLPAGGERP
jgi:hypothetical protein